MKNRRASIFQGDDASLVQQSHYPTQHNKLKKKHFNETYKSLFSTKQSGGEISVYH